MITAQALATLTQFSAPALTRAINLAGYKEDKFTGAKFLGMTNGCEFCYHIVHAVKGGTDSAKMFLRYDPTADRVIANIG